MSLLNKSYSGGPLSLYFCVSESIVVRWFQTFCFRCWLNCHQELLYKYTSSVLSKGQGKTIITERYSYIHSFIICYSFLWMQLCTTGWKTRLKTIYIPDTKLPSTARCSLKFSSMSAHVPLWLCAAELWPLRSLCSPHRDQCVLSFFFPPDALRGLGSDLSSGGLATGVNDNRCLRFPHRLQPCVVNPFSVLLKV